MHSLISSLRSIHFWLFHPFWWQKGVRRDILVEGLIMNPSAAAASLLCYGGTCALCACATTTRPLLPDYLPTSTSISRDGLNYCIRESPEPKLMHQLRG